MQIYVEKNGSKIGPYTVEQIREMVALGQLSPRDLAWHEGLPQWAMLEKLPGLLLSGTQPAAKQSGVKAWMVVLGVFLGLGALGGIMQLVDPPKNSNATATQNPPAPTPQATPTPVPPADALAQAKSALNWSGSSEPSLEALKRGVGYLKEIPATAKEYKEAQGLLKKFGPQLEAAEADEAALGKKPENSPLNGKVREVDEYLAKTLNDYDSSEYVEWSPVVRTKVGRVSYWAVRLKLRAKNGFGAYIVKDTYYLIRGGEVVKANGL